MSALEDISWMRTWIGEFMALTLLFSCGQAVL